MRIILVNPTRSTPLEGWRLTYWKWHRNPRTILRWVDRNFRKAVETFRKAVGNFSESCQATVLWTALKDPSVQSVSQTNHRLHFTSVSTKPWNVCPGGTVYQNFETIRTVLGQFCKNSHRILTPGFHIVVSAILNTTQKYPPPRLALLLVLTQS